MLVSQEDNFKLFDDDPASTIVAGDLMEKKLISIVLLIRSDIDLVSISHSRAQPGGK